MHPPAGSEPKKQAGLVKMNVPQHLAFRSTATPALLRSDQAELQCTGLSLQQAARRERASLACLGASPQQSCVQCSALVRSQSQAVRAMLDRKLSKVDAELCTNTIVVVWCGVVLSALTPVVGRQCSKLVEPFESILGDALPKTLCWNGIAQNSA